MSRKSLINIWVLLFKLSNWTIYQQWWAGRERSQRGGAALSCYKSWWFCCLFKSPSSYTHIHIQINNAQAGSSLSHRNSSNSSKVIVIFFGICLNCNNNSICCCLCVGTSWLRNNFYVYYLNFREQNKVTWNEPHEKLCHSQN